MLRYLKAAFWARPAIPGIGSLPVNVIAFAGLLILGFGHPGFWFLAMALEAGYLYTVSSSPRFKRVVDAQDIHLEEGEADRQRTTLVGTLSADRRGRLEQLESKCANVIDTYRESQTESYLVESNRHALQKLTWLYLKLLVAQQNLTAMHKSTTVAEIEQQIELIQKDLRYDKISPSLKESKQATLAILQQRLAVFEKRSESLQEMESDLTRIEAQVDLAVENAGMRGKPEAISANIDLVSHLLDDSLFGDSGASVAALDERFQIAHRHPEGGV